jgi:hypothetical protein
MKRLPNRLIRCLHLQRPLGYCNDRMSSFQAQVDRDRPGHVWAVIEGKVVYLEDKIMEGILGRGLKSTEVVVHKNGNLFDNRQENLELVSIEGMDISNVQ